MDGTVASNCRLGLEGMFNEVLSNTGFRHVILSRYHNNALRAEGVGTQVLAYVLTDLTVDTQRRRLH